MAVLDLSQTPKDFAEQVRRETMALEGIEWVGRCSTQKQSARSYKALVEQAALSSCLAQLMEACSALLSWMETAEYARFPTVAATLKTYTNGSALIMEWNEWSKATAFAAHRWIARAKLTDEELDKLLALAAQLQ